MARNVKLSSISFPGVSGSDPGRKEKAVAQALDWVDQAACDQPDMILLPEVFTSLGGDSEKWIAEAEPVPGPTTDLLAAKAKEHGCYVWCPLFEKAHEGVYNSAVLLGRTGELVGGYRKTYPTIGELEMGVLPGAGAVTFSCDFGRVGALICFDLNFRELGAQYRQQAAELICFLSMFRGGLQLSIWAYEFRMFLASSTPVENSRIVNPLGQVLADSSVYSRLITRAVNLDTAVLHLDGNQEKFRALKDKYGPLVELEICGPEAVFLMTSHHPEKSVDSMIAEFEMERVEDYYQRARHERAARLTRT